MHSGPWLDSFAFSPFTPQEAFVNLAPIFVTGLFAGGVSFKSAGVRGCIRAFVIRDEQKILPADGETRIDLGVLQPGRLDYACGMGMYTGTLTIV